MLINEGRMGEGGGTSPRIQLLQGGPGRRKVLCGFDIPVLDAEENATHCCKE